MAHQDQPTNALHIRPHVRQEDEHSRRHGPTAYTGMFYLEDFCYGQFICTLCSCSNLRLAGGTLTGL